MLQQTKDGKVPLHMGQSALTIREGKMERAPKKSARMEIGKDEPAQPERNTEPIAGEEAATRKARLVETMP